MFFSSIFFIIFHHLVICIYIYIYSMYFFGFSSQLRLIAMVCFSKFLHGPPILINFGSGVWKMSFRSGIWPYNVIHSGLHVKFWGFTASALRLRWPCVLSGLNYFILWWSAVERGWGWQMLDASDSRGISRWFLCGIYIYIDMVYMIYIYIL